MTSLVNNYDKAQGGLVSHLCNAYAHLLRRQRTASSAFVNWGDQTRRGHEFVWLGGVFQQEVLMKDGRPLRVSVQS